MISSLSEKSSLGLTYLANDTQYMNLTIDINDKLIECYKYNKFWISWLNENFTFGRGEDHNQSIIATWNVGEQFLPNRLYVRGMNVKGEGFIQWKFDRDYGRTKI